MTTSITEDVQGIKDLADEYRRFTDDEILAPLPKKFKLAKSCCEICGDRLQHEPGHPGSDDEPASKSGWWCDTCEDWK